MKLLQNKSKKSTKIKKGINTGIVSKCKQKKDVSLKNVQSIKRLKNRLKILKRYQCLYYIYVFVSRTILLSFLIYFSSIPVTVQILLLLLRVLFESLRRLNCFPFFFYQYFLHSFVHRCILSIRRTVSLVL